MNRDESLTIVGMILTAWPGGEPWTADQMETYGVGIIDLPADVTTAAVADAHKNEKFRPNVATLREYVAAARQRAQRDRVRERAPEGEGEMPEWVCGWAVARYRHGDMRAWPQQRPGYDRIQTDNPGHKTHQWTEQEIMPADEQARYETEGRDLTPSMVHAMIGAA